MESFLKKSKHRLDSSVLGRPAHFDLLGCAPDPSWMLLLFGGSGVTRREYEARRDTVIPIFDEVLKQCPLSARVVFVTAPFDVPYARMAEGDAAADAWAEHVEAEILTN